jgi:2-dehydro-3-deoxyphosphogluconate aldolase / (4S)-4-hydroxy-2-oxoglutarate aldolase
MQTIIDQLKAMRIIPAIVCKDIQHADPVAAALEQGGLPCAEVTFRTPGAAEVIKRMAERPKLLVGAGTVLTVDRAAIDAGSRFIVSPGFNAKVVQFCQSHKVPIFPGVSTPTEIEMAMDLGITIVKFFPAEAFGGVTTLKALNGPYPSIRFIPTGGIGIQNLQDYLKLPYVLACGGSWMVTSSLIESSRFDQIARLTTEAVTAALPGQKP